MLKPYIGPLAILAGQVAWDQFVGDVNDLLTGVLFGIAIFWLIMSLFGHRALMRRYPGILEWAPFLDPARALGSPGELTAKNLNGHTFRITDIAHDSKISSRSFDDCDVHGPAVLLPKLCNFHFCTLDMPAEALVVVVDQEKVWGVIEVYNCKFDNCRFHGIGFMGGPGLLEEVVGGTASPDSEQKSG